jgi:hypothetical protein
MPVWVIPGPHPGCPSVPSPFLSLCPADDDTVRAVKRDKAVEGVSNAWYAFKDYGELRRGGLAGIQKRT